MSDAVLASWNDGHAKEAILDFVKRVTTDGPDFVAPADRIATFDNDGTLWVEQPLPPSSTSCSAKWAEEVKADPHGRGSPTRPYRKGPGVLRWPGDPGPRDGSRS